MHHVSNPCSPWTGYYESEEEAARAWDLAALKHFGETAEVKSKLNFQTSVTLFRQQKQQHGAAATAAAAQAVSGAGGSGGGGGGAAQHGSVGPSLCSAEAQFRGVHRVRRCGCVHGSGGNAGPSLVAPALAKFGTNLSMQGTTPSRAHPLPSHPSTPMQTGDGRFRCIVTQKRTPFIIGTFDTGEETGLWPARCWLLLLQARKSAHAAAATLGLLHWWHTLVEHPS